MNRFCAAVTHGGLRRPVRLAWLAAAGLLAAGCATTPPSPAQAKLTNAEITVLTSSGLTGQDAAQVNNAYEGLVKRCMESKRFVYYPLIQAANSMSPHLQLAGIPQADVGLAAREANGYGFYSSAAQPASFGQSGETDPEDRYIASLPITLRQKYLQALQGLPGNCHVPRGNGLVDPGRRVPGSGRAADIRVGRQLPAGNDGRLTPDNSALPHSHR